MSCSVWKLHLICWNRSCYYKNEVSQVSRTIQSCYYGQAVLPLFLGHLRQIGSGLGSLAAGVGQVTFFFRKKWLSTSCQINRERMFVQSLPEMMDVATKKVSQTSSKISVEKNIEKANRRECSGQKE